VLLGPSYGPAVPVVRLLSPVPLIRTVQYFAANALTGAERQGARTAVQVATAAMNVLLNLALIPVLGVSGAVVATLAAELLMAAGLWLLLMLLPDGDGGGPPVRSRDFPSRLRTRGEV
jgi:O-antigen/teichoic acid export membrane protein